jgi:hypothetical protein
MSDMINVTLEDDDGNVILPPEPQKQGNAFAIRHVPRKGDEVQVNDTRYTVIDVIHHFHHDTPATLSLRLRPRSLELDE